jgi:hypothetical protein
MDNNDNKEILKETNDVPCCSKTLEDKMENDSSNINKKSIAEQQPII